MKLSHDMCYKVINGQDAIKLELSYRPPYNWDMMMQFYGMRTIPGVEWVTESGIYRRSIQIEQGNLTYSGWLELNPIPSDNVVAVIISKSLEKVLMIVIKLIRIAFDLDAMPDLLHPDLPSGIRLPGCFDAFEMATRAILGQQITVKAARTLAKRMVNLLGKSMISPWEEINHHFPSAQQIAEIVEPISEVLGPIGVIKSRSNSVLALASAISKGDIKLEAGEKPEIVKEKLLAVKGIGPWTAEYLTMRGLSWPDAFPVTDIGVKHGLAPLLLDEDGKLVMGNNNEKEQTLSKHALNKKYVKYALEYAESYRPWRSYLTIALWHSLSNK